MPDIEAIRSEALRAGALDPMSLRFRIVEVDRFSGEVLGVPAADIGLHEAINTTASLIQSHFGSNFCLEPVGFVQ
jgi:hypothetical protein